VEETEAAGCCRANQWITHTSPLLGGREIFVLLLRLAAQALLTGSSNVRLIQESVL
jgi:hypothetical protein